MTVQRPLVLLRNTSVAWWILDIWAGRHVQSLPEDLAKPMLAQAGRVVDLDEEIDGDVAL